MELLLRFPFPSLLLLSKTISFCIQYWWLLLSSINITLGHCYHKLSQNGLAMGFILVFLLIEQESQCVLHMLFICLKIRYVWHTEKNNTVIWVHLSINDILKGTIICTTWHKKLCWELSSLFPGHVFKKLRIINRHTW